MEAIIWITGLLVIVYLFLRNRAQIQAMIKETGDQELAENPPMGDDVLDALETDPSLSK